MMVFGFWLCSWMPLGTSITQSSILALVTEFLNAPLDVELSFYV